MVYACFIHMRVVHMMLIHRNTVFDVSVSRTGTRVVYPLA